MSRKFMCVKNVLSMHSGNIIFTEGEVYMQEGQSIRGNSIGTLLYMSRLQDPYDSYDLGNCLVEIE